MNNCHYLQDVSLWKFTIMAVIFASGLYSILVKVRKTFRIELMGQAVWPNLALFHNAMLTNIEFYIKILCKINNILLFILHNIFM